MCQETSYSYKVRFYNTNFLINKISINGDRGLFCCLYVLPIYIRKHENGGCKNLMSLRLKRSFQSPKSVFRNIKKFLSVKVKPTYFWLIRIEKWNTRQLRTSTTSPHPCYLFTSTQNSVILTSLCLSNLSLYLSIKTRKMIVQWVRFWVLSRRNW